MAWSDSLRAGGSADALGVDLLDPEEGQVQVGEVDPALDRIRTAEDDLENPEASASPRFPTERS